jgi:CHASE3 domain sensor protein
MRALSLKKLTLGQKLYGGFGVALAIVAVLGVVVLLSMGSMNQRSAQQVSASTEQTSASTQEIAASAQELATTAEQLEKLVGQFKIAA